MIVPEVSLPGPLLLRQFSKSHGPEDEARGGDEGEEREVSEGVGNNEREFEGVAKGVDQGEDEDDAEQEEPEAGEEVENKDHGRVVFGESQKGGEHRGVVLMESGEGVKEVGTVKIIEPAENAAGEQGQIDGEGKENDRTGGPDAGISESALEKTAGPPDFLTEPVVKAIGNHGFDMLAALFNAEAVLVEPECVVGIFGDGVGCEALICEEDGDAGHEAASPEGVNGKEIAGAHEEAVHIVFEGLHGGKNAGIGRCAGATHGAEAWGVEHPGEEFGDGFGIQLCVGVEKEHEVVFAGVDGAVEAEGFAQILGLVDNPDREAFGQGGEKGCGVVGTGIVNHLHVEHGTGPGGEDTLHGLDNIFSGIVTGNQHAEGLRLGFLSMAAGIHSDADDQGADPKKKE